MYAVVNGNADRWASWDVTTTTPRGRKNYEVTQQWVFLSKTYKKHLRPRLRPWHLVLFSTKLTHCWAGMNFQLHHCWCHPHLLGSSTAICVIYASSLSPQLSTAKKISIFCDKFWNFFGILWPVLFCKLASITNEIPYNLTISPLWHLTYSNCHNNCCITHKN